MKSLLAGETVSAEGDYVKLREVQLELPPATPPDVLAGTTGPRGLDLAERACDGVLLPEGCGPAFVRWALADRPAMGRCVVYAWLAVDDEPEDALKRVSPALQHWSASEHYPLPRELAGLSGPPARLEEAKLPELSARISVTGDPAACARAIEELFAAGASDVILVPQGDEPLHEIERLASEIAPRVEGVS